ncbi:anti-sigma-D factor RsdA [Catellatospora vulcania]|uniref:anti-sigma-D factor RsdA n=1 Tax=Catellatospora vulcania TaxID=1460450 RepID=UPI0012D43A30|nr:anti-sigma-D factor RsdA [Catellatospora vulcania]
MSTLDRDDALLDGLGLGGAAHSDDALAGLLAAWRDDLTEPPFAPTLDLDEAEHAALAGPIDIDDLFGTESEQEATVLRPATAVPRGAAGSSRPPSRRDGSPRPVRGGRLRPGRLMLAAALLVGVLGGGFVGAGAGQPGTPLWPVTQLVFAERAESRVAAQDVEQLLAQADRALREQRRGDAEQFLRQAWDRLGEVREKSDHERLRAELMRLLTAFAAVAAPSTPAAPPTPVSSPRPAGGTTAPSPATTGPSPTPGAGGILPGLPPLLPSLLPILPSLLPDLPLL